MKKTAMWCVLLLCSLCLSAQTGKTALRTELSVTGGKTASVLSDTDVSEELAQKIRAALEAAWSIPGLEGNAANVLIQSPQDFRFVLYPTALTYRGIDLIPYLPAGLAFYYTTALFYDITLKVDEYAPRVTGLYVSPDDLLKNLYAATIMPDRYMFDNYLLNRVDRLEAALMALSKKTLFTPPRAVDEDIILAIRSYYNENRDLTKKEAAARLKKDGIKASKADIDAVFLVLLGKSGE